MNSTFIRMACLLPFLALAGCASQYDCYPCGKVSCHYCPPKPLPYSNNQSCNCNDSIGRVYLASLQQPVSPETASELVPDSYYQVSDPADQEEGSESKDSPDKPAKPSSEEPPRPSPEESDSPSEETSD